MPKKSCTKQILMACQMSFHGSSNKEIANKFGFTEATVGSWQNTELWQEFEAELIQACKEELLKPENFSLEPVTPS